MPRKTFDNLPKEKKKQIIDAGIRLFSSESFKEVKVSKIIREADIPRSSFYDYFDDKEDFYVALIKQIGAQKEAFYLEHHKDQNENSGYDFFDELKHLYSLGIRFSLQNTAYDRFLKNAVQNMDILKKNFGDEVLDTSALYKQMLVRGIESGSLRSDMDIDFTATIISVLSAQMMVKGVSDQRTIEAVIDEMTCKMIDIIRRGIQC